MNNLKRSSKITKYKCTDAAHLVHMQSNDARVKELAPYGVYTYDELFGKRSIGIELNNQSQSRVRES